MTFTKKFITLFILVAIGFPIGLFIFGWINWNPNMVSPVLTQFQHQNPKLLTKFDSDYFSVTTNATEEGNYIFFQGKKNENRITFYFPRNEKTVAELEQLFLRKTGWQFNTTIEPSGNNTEWVAKKNNFQPQNNMSGSLEIGILPSSETNETSYFSVASTYRSEDEILFLKKQADIFYHLWLQE